MSVSVKPVNAVFSFPVDLLHDFEEQLGCKLNRADKEGLCSDTIELLEAAKESITTSKTRGRMSLGFLGKDHPFTRISASMLEGVVDYSHESYLLYVESDDRDEDARPSSVLTPSQHADLRKRIDRWRETGSFVLPRKKLVNISLDQAVERKTSARQLKQQAFRALVESEAKVMVAHACAMLMRKASPVAGTRRFAEQLVLKVSWSMSRAASRGGVRNKRGWVSLAISNLKDEVGVYLFTEYFHIGDSPQIGSCHGGWRIYLAALVAHEVAHAAQHASLPGYAAHPVGLKEFSVGDMKKAHGFGWQEIYRYLRVNWVNKLDGYQSGAGEL